MANYLTTDSELQSVADAIRGKTGGSESLVYPSGFISAIQEIPSGGSGINSVIQYYADFYLKEVVT